MQDNILANWQEERLDQLLELIIDHRGITPKKLGGNWSNDGVPALSAKNIKGGKIINNKDIKYIDQKLYERWMPEKLLNEDILLTSEAPLGELYFLKEKTDYVLSQRLFALRSKKNQLDPRYLYYFLLSPVGKHELQRRLSGTAAQGIRQAELRQINITFPKQIKVQQKIAAILSIFDDKIEVNNKIAKVLEQMTQVIFKEWFEKNKKGQWQEKNIGDVCKTYGGGTPSTKESSYWKNGSIFWATPTDMTKLKGPYIFNTEKKITETGLKHSSVNLLPKGSILMTSRATVGILAISQVPITINQGFISIVCEGKLSNLFMNCWLKRNIKLVQGLATGSTFPEISRGVFRKIKIVVPDKGILDNFNIIVKPIFTQIANIIQENQKLAKMRDLLLPKLMRGEIRV